MKPVRGASFVGAMLALLLSVGCGGGDEAQPPVQDSDADAVAAAPSPIEEDPQEPTVEPLDHDQVRVYFPAAGGDGLIAETREIFQTTTPGDRAKQILAGLIEGPESNGAIHAVPRGTRLRQVYVLQNGVAYVDFSRDLADGLGGGSMRELLTVYAIVDSVTRNVPEVRAVGLLIEGRVAETLNGHLDLRYPLRPNYSMVLADRDLDPDAEPDADPPIRVAERP